MARIRANTSSGGGSMTPVRDWDFKYYSSISSTTTCDFGYEPKRVVISFLNGTTHYTKLYDADVDKTNFTAYTDNGAKTTQAIASTVWSITSNGVSVAPGGNTYSRVMILASSD